MDKNDIEEGKPNLIGLSYKELEEQLVSIGEQPFRAKQLWHWLYHQGIAEFSLMSNINKELKAKLEEHFTINRPVISRNHISFDETQKFLLQFADRQEAETVYIPEDDRGTLCISSQVGCSLTCKFCHTGTQKLVRNLSSYDIVSQVMVARDILGEWPTPSDNRKISNIVLMGMGEPLYNYDNVAKAMQIVMDSHGIALSKRRITLSTSGVVPMMERCGKELGINLAVSLHAVTNELRDYLVPLNKKYPLEELLAACRNYPSASNAKRITFEYVMLKGVNDSDQDAKELIRLIKGIPAKINLIPFNHWPGSNFECSTQERIQAFAEIINKAGYASPVRKPRGRDILAACGQLRSESIRESKSKLKKILTY